MATTGDLIFGGIILYGCIITPSFFGSISILKEKDTDNYSVGFYWKGIRISIIRKFCAVFCLIFSILLFITSLLEGFSEFHPRDPHETYLNIIWLLFLVLTILPGSVLLYISTTGKDRFKEIETEEEKAEEKRKLHKRLERERKEIELKKKREREYKERQEREERERQERKERERIRQIEAVRSTILDAEKKELNLSNLTWQELVNELGKDEIIKRYSNSTNSYEISTYDLFDN